MASVALICSSLAFGPHDDRSRHNGAAFFPLPCGGQEVVLGRRDVASIAVDSRAVSRRHLRLAVKPVPVGTDGHTDVVDLSCLPGAAVEVVNATSVDGAKGEPQILKPGASTRVSVGASLTLPGGVRLDLVSWSASAGTTAASAKAAAAKSTTAVEDPTTAHAPRPVVLVDAATNTVVRHFADAMVQAAPPGGTALAADSSTSLSKRRRGGDAALPIIASSPHDTTQDDDEHDLLPPVGPRSQRILSSSHGRPLARPAAAVGSRRSGPPAAATAPESQALGTMPPPVGSLGDAFNELFDTLDAQPARQQPYLPPLSDTTPPADPQEGAGPERKISRAMIAEAVGSSPARGVGKPGGIAGTAGTASSETPATRTRRDLQQGVMDSQAVYYGHMEASLLPPHDNSTT